MLCAMEHDRLENLTYCIVIHHAYMDYYNIDIYSLTGNNLLQKNCVAVVQTCICQGTIVHANNRYTNIFMCSIRPQLCSKMHRYVGLHQSK